MKRLNIYIVSSRETKALKARVAYVVLSCEDEFVERGLSVRIVQGECAGTCGEVDSAIIRRALVPRKRDALIVLWRHGSDNDLQHAVNAAAASGVPYVFLLDSCVRANSGPCNFLNGGTCVRVGGLVDVNEAILSFVRRIPVDTLEDCEPQTPQRTVDAFFASDDELAEDRNAFAEMILQLNDQLQCRGVHVKMKFYTPERHRQLFERSEMAMVVYRTRFGAFGPKEMEEAYERTIHKRNPKRLYVFFREENGESVEKEFFEFKEGFEKGKGHFICRFENVDTLKLNFLFSLENLLGGEEVALVRLNGDKIKVGDLMVAEVGALPTVQRNSALQMLRKQLDALSYDCVAAQTECSQQPADEDLAARYCKLLQQKNDLAKRIEKELAVSFDLFRRLASISIGESNEGIVRARGALEKGDVRAALRILEEASGRCAGRRRYICSRADSWVEECAQAVVIFESQVDVALCRCEGYLRDGELPCAIKLARIGKVCKPLLDDMERYAECSSIVYKGKMDALCMSFREKCNLMLKRVRG